MRATGSHHLLDWTKQVAVDGWQGGGSPRRPLPGVESPLGLAVPAPAAFTPSYRSPEEEQEDVVSEGEVGCGRL